MIATNVTTLLSTIRGNQAVTIFYIVGIEYMIFFYSEQLILHLNIAIIVTLFKNNSIVCCQ